MTSVSIPLATPDANATNGFTAVNGDASSVSTSFRLLADSDESASARKPSPGLNGSIKRKPADAENMPLERGDHDLDARNKRPRHSIGSSKSPARSTSRDDTVAPTASDNRATPISIRTGSASPRSSTAEDTPDWTPDHARSAEAQVAQGASRPDPAMSGAESSSHDAAVHRDQNGDGTIEPINGDGHTRRKREFSHRTKTGCHTCRMRKKKCDEGKPICDNCVKGKFECAGYGPKPPGGFEKGFPRARVKHTQMLQSKPAEFGSSGRQAGEMIWHHHPFNPPYGAEPPRATQPFAAYAPQPSYPPGPSMPPSQHHSGPPPPSQSQPPGPLPPSSHHQQHQPAPAPPPSQPAPSPFAQLPLGPPVTQGMRDTWHGQAYAEGSHVHLQLNSLGNVDYKHIIPPWTQREPRDSRSVFDSALTYRPTPPPGSTIEPYRDRHNSGLNTLPPIAFPNSKRDNPPVTFPNSEREKMFMGQTYAHWKDEDLIKDRKECKKALDLFNRAALPAEGMSDTDRSLRFKAVLDPEFRETITRPGRAGSCGRNTIVESPFHVDYGYNLHIGEGTVIHANCNIQDPCLVSIGNEVTIGPDVKIYGMSARMDPFNRTGSRSDFVGGAIRIADNVWIGGGAIILPFRVIGKGAIVGAGSVVTRNVKPYTVVAGNPAKEVRSITEGAGDRRMRNDIEEENQEMRRDMERHLRETRRSGR